MKKMIQLNLTEEESLILEAIVAVGISIHFKDASRVERNTCFMELLLSRWPEASESLAEKMTGLVDINMEMIEAK
ncbi:hypothetical protein LCGC14_2323180 [marine sediment metagenome]|uniref:Uncharacterized protein n=1 Tax=marine sediment metagenome TaxID=412755 RepID=A0A0F9D4Q8_9ZZZZ